MKKATRKLLVALFAVMMMVGMGTCAFATDGETAIADGTYQLNAIEASTGMFTINQPAMLVVNGEDATLTLEANATAAKRYYQIYIGNYSDITEENQDTIGITGEVTDNGIQFVVPLKTANLSADGAINFVVRYKAGYSDTHDNDWYNAKTHFTMTLGEFTPVVTEDLEITNNTGMFRAVTASLVTAGEEQNIVMALNGSGYQYLYKGTYEEAVANGDNRDNWIAGYQNDAGKWEFVVPVASGETYIPIVAISNKYLTAYDNGEGTLEEAFYPRQMELDATAKTLVTGDYDKTVEVAVTNNVSMFKPGTTADLRVVGGPNSNNYKALLTLHMESASYDMVKATEYSNYNKEMTAGEEVEIPLGEDNTFAEVPVLPDDTVTLQFRSAKKQEYYKRNLTVDLAAKTVTFDPYPGDVIVKEIAACESEEAAAEYAKQNATPEFTDLLIEAIQVQNRDENTDKLCAAAKAAWDALTDEQKAETDDPDYFGLDTGDASADDPLNTDPDKEKELLVVSFGTSFNTNRVETIGAVEKALTDAYGADYAVRRAFTAQIIINHVQARDGEKIDNVEQAMDKAVAAGVKEMIVQPTHLMSGAEYDELVAAIDQYADKMTITYAKPLLDSDADKEAVAKAVVAAAAADAGFASTEEAIASTDTAFVFMGHGTAHTANATYTYMQETMTKLGYTNCFVGTVEGLPEETEVNTVLKKVQDAGYTKVILRPLMVVAGDHANNDMAGDDEDSWKSIFAAALGADNVTCQIQGLGAIAEVQQMYVAHTDTIVNPAADPMAKQTLKIAKAQKTKVVKFKKLKKKAQTTTKVKVTGAKTKVTYAKVAKGSAKVLTINKTTGKIKVKKGTKKGTYKIKIKVTAAKSANYYKATTTAIIKVKVK